MQIAFTNIEYLKAKIPIRLFYNSTLCIHVIQWQLVNVIMINVIMLPFNMLCIILILCVTCLVNKLLQYKTIRLLFQIWKNLYAKTIQYISIIKQLVIVILWLMLSVSLCLAVITLSCFHCNKVENISQSVGNQEQIRCQSNPPVSSKRIN